MRVMDAEEVTIWLKLQELIVMAEWAALQRNQCSDTFTTAAQHMREAGHALRFGCCRAGGEQLAIPEV